MLRVLDLFSGIGGFSLGLERTGGFETVAFCEIEPFPRKVLAKHWPEVPIYDDVRTLTAARLAADGIAVDVITGGFPCQDLSVAGKQRGMGGGTRSGLWSEIIRLACDLRPAFIIIENVPALLDGPSEQPGGWFSRVLTDLAECGLDAEWQNIPAAALGGAHVRERVWLVAYPNGKRSPRRGVFSYIDRTPETKFSGRKFQIGKTDYDGLGGVVWDTTASRIWRVDHGIPNRLDRFKTIGNAVVPQIPELIGNAILAAITSFASQHPAGDTGLSIGSPVNLPAVDQCVDGGLFSKDVK